MSRIDHAEPLSLARAGAELARSRWRGRRKLRTPHGGRMHSTSCTVPSSPVPRRHRAHRLELVDPRLAGRVACGPAIDRLTRSSSSPRSRSAAGYRPGERTRETTSQPGGRSAGCLPSGPSAWSAVNPLGSNDPPVIVALAGLPPPQLFRLSHAAGQAKAALAADPEACVAAGPSQADASGGSSTGLRDRFGPEKAATGPWAQRPIARRSRGAERRPALPGRPWV